jgi:two-component system, cell cycle sensor histidine kinase and response regulator CckA
MKYKKFIVGEDSERLTVPVLLPETAEETASTVVEKLADGAVMDVNERQNAENSVRFQGLLLDTVQQAVFATDLEGNITYWNRFAGKIFGWTAAEVIGKNLLQLVLPDASQHGGLKKTSKYKQGKSRTDEMILQKRNRTLFPAQIVNSPLHDASERKIGTLGIVTDITGLKITEKENISLNTEIQSQRERLNAIIGNIPGVVWEAGLIREGSNRYVNFVSEYVEKMIGYTVEEWLSEPNFWLDIIHPEDREHAELEMQTFIENNGKGVQQYRWIAKDGRAVWVETQMVLVSDENGKPYSLRGISIDVSERKVIEEALQKSEEQLRQSQKLESVGRLAGGIAHDFNNMLTAINGYSDLILRELGDDDSLRKKVLEIKKAGERSAALTHQLLAFSRRQVLQPKLIDLNKIVNEMNQMLFRLIGEDIQLNIKLAAPPSWVEADPGQLSQVIMNLVVNAGDAMPQGGQLTIKTEKVRFHKEPVTRFAPQLKEHFIKMSVIDTGIGIEDKILEQIFEPFFTTKQVGAGTGLGLSTVYGIVKQSGGYIWVNSKPGKGSEFYIYLPYVGEKAAGKKERKPSEQFPHGTEKILLVEDEEMVRNLTRRILEVCGYTVIEARNGIEALKICEENNFEIDLLMTDVVMPQMDGRELSEKVADINPQIRTLFTSGYMNDRIMRLGVSSEAVNFIQKPFAPDVLARKIREMLDMES